VIKSLLISQPNNHYAQNAVHNYAVLTETVHVPFLCWKVDELLAMFHTEKKPEEAVEKN